MKWEKLKKIFQPKEVAIYLSNKKPFHYLPDNLFLELKYRLEMGTKLNLNNPMTYNEKIQYLKLNDRNPLFTKLVDKYEVRDYVELKIGNEYLVPLYGVYENFEEINFDNLPNQFVLKTTHDSGGVVICKDKSKFNKEFAREKLEKSLKTNFFWRKREWPYKDVKPRIICEKYMEDITENQLKDYKFFCFDGKPEFMFIAADRETKTRFDFFDMEFNNIPVKNYYSRSEKPEEIQKPILFDEMVRLSEKLSEGFKHLRVDFYIVNGKIYFGELTFYHFSGMKKFEPEKYDKIFGEYINL